MPTINQRAAAGADPGTPESTLRELAADASPKVRAAVAANPSSPTDVLNGLADDGRWNVRYGVAENPSPRAISSALNSSYADVRGLVVKRKDLDTATRLRILSDPDRRLRLALAEVCSDPDILTALARDRDPGVRATTVRNPCLPLAVVEQLAKDRRAGVRAAVAASRRVHPETLTRLANDRSAVVRWHAADGEPGAP